MPKNSCHAETPIRIGLAARSVVLAGNPNSGKTSLFNELTGARQRVGNYPGVTVERKEGYRRHGGLDLRIIDLPGTYSLSPVSEEERVARDVLLSGEVDVVVCVLDASCLERNLYFAVQLIERGLPVVVALNMIDAARERGLDIDRTRLEQLLRTPVVETVGRRGDGVESLLEAIAGRIAFAAETGFRIDYGEVVEREIEHIAGLVGVAVPELEDAERRRRAIALLAGEGGTTGSGLSRMVRERRRALERRVGDPIDVVLAERRHGAATGVAREVTRRSLARRRDLTDLVDLVLVNRVLGMPIFLAAMYAVFFLTFRVADPMAVGIESGFAALGGLVEGWWPAASAPLLRSLVVDGIIGGVGGVIVFLPNIVLLFMAISVLEDSGYMARAAFLMDRLMRAIGLHGKSFIPMLLGFGCSVPAVMATRTIESRRARLTTMLVIPLMSCGARLPIYALLIPAFFPAAWHAPVLWVVYVTGVGLALGLASLLRSTLFRGEGLPFVMELPPYRVPTLRSVVLHMWERSWIYLRKAGTVILGISIVMWALSTFPRLDPEAAAGVAQELPAAVAADPEAVQLAHSFAGRLGRLMEPVLRPMGFDWRIGTALVGAFAAKEVFVAQMGIVFAVGDAGEAGASSLRARLRATYPPLVGLSVMLFCLIASPCMATLAVVRRESGSWRWAALQFLGLTAVAWVVATAVYQGGRALGLGL